MTNDDTNYSNYYHSHLPPNNTAYHDEEIGKLLDLSDTELKHIIRNQIDKMRQLGILN